MCGKHLLAWIAAPSFFFCSLMNAQQASPPRAFRLVKFSGKAVDSQGKTVSGTFGVTFAIYKDQYEGAPLWLETQNVTADSGRVVRPAGCGWGREHEGRRGSKSNYTVQLSATKPAGSPLDLFSSGERRWLGGQVIGQAEHPRVLLLSLPYALKAAEAETIGG
jgi:hypothetical protein